MNDRSTLFKVLLGLIVLSRLLLFGAVRLRPDLAVKSDSTEYVALAHNLWNAQSFSTSAQPPLRPDTNRTPGYPIFLIPFLQLFSSPILWIIAFQLLLSVLTCLILWRWTGTWSGGQPALLAMAILGLDWVTMAHMPILMTESLFLLFYLLAILTTWESLHAQSSGTWKAGLLWSLAIMVRPVVLYLPVFISLLWIRRPKALLIFFLAAYLLPAGWVCRNRVVAHFGGFTSIDGIALLRYPAAGVESLRSGRPMSAVQDDLVHQAETTLGPHPGEVDYRNAYNQLARTIIRAHPWLLSEYCLHGAIRILGGTGLEMIPQFMGAATSDDLKSSDSASVAGRGTRALLRRYPALLPLQIAYLLGLAFSYLAFLKGSWRLWKNKRRSECILLLGTAAYILAISSHQGYYRFRIPLIPLIAIGAAASMTPDLGRRRLSAELI